MLAHQSLPTLQHEKPCFDAQKVKRQEMYISTSSPRTTPHNWVVGTITQLIAAVTIAPRRYTLRHTTSCMRFSSQHITLPHVPQHGSYCTRSTFPHSEKHNTRALHPYKADIACNEPRFTAHPSPWHHTENLAPSNKYSALSDPTIEAPVGTSRGIFLYRMRCRLTTSHNPTYKLVSQHALRACIIYVGNTYLMWSL